MQGLTWLWVLEGRGVSEVPRESETGQGETEWLCEGAHSGNHCLLGGDQIVAMLQIEGVEFVLWESHHVQTWRGKNEPILLLH